MPVVNGEALLVIGIDLDGATGTEPSVCSSIMSTSIVLVAFLLTAVVTDLSAIDIGVIPILGSFKASRSSDLRLDLSLTFQKREHQVLQVVDPGLSSVGQTCNSL